MLTDTQYQIKAKILEIFLDYFEVEDEQHKPIIQQMETSDMEILSSLIAQQLTIPHPPVKIVSKWYRLFHFWKRS